MTLIGEPPAETKAGSFCPECGSALEAPAAVCACLARREAKLRAGPVVTEAGWLRASLTLYFTLLGVSLASTIIAGIADASGVPYVTLEIGQGLAFSVVIAGFCIAGRRHLRAPLATLGAAKWYALAPVAALGTFVLASAILMALDRALGISTLNYLEDYAAAGAPWWLPVLMICVQPAIFEELAFRGLIGSSLGFVLGARDGLIVTALLFSILHLSPFSFVHLAIIGLALGLLRRGSGSLYPCMLMHFCHNGLVLLSDHLAWTLDDPLVLP